MFRLAPAREAERSDLLSGWGCLPCRFARECRRVVPRPFRSASSSGHRKECNLEQRQQITRNESERVRRTNSTLDGIAND